MKIFIVGVGPGSGEYVLPIARREIKRADCLVGAKRLIALFPDFKKEKIFIDGHLDEALSYVKKFKNRKKIAVLVSGDPGMYSLLGRISKVLKPEEYSVIPGISTVQLAFARIGESWSDAKIISLHGREPDHLASEIKTSAKVFLLTDSAFPPNKIAHHLIDAGLENRRMVVLENLTYSDERITDTDLKSAIRIKTAGLCAMIIERFERQTATRAGKLYGIGIGPGDPKLITLKAKEILDRVNTIFVPKSSEDGTSLARSIVESVTGRKKKFVEITFPMTRDQAVLDRSWRRAAKCIAATVEREEAAFVTIGDPFIYSTYVYLLKMIQKHYRKIQVETIPGISAFNAAASAAGLALVEGNEQMAVVPVTKSLAGVREALQTFDTVVLMKVGSKLGQVTALLKELDLTQRAILISRVGHPDERIIRNLGALRDKKTGYLSVIMVKKKGCA